jgi:hypothetical protein
MKDVRVYIEDSVHFQTQSSYDAEWDSLFPHDGLVYLGDKRQPFTPSIFHQLRCLNFVRKAVVDLSSRNVTEAIPPSDLTRHCISYLRQMVLCRGDPELDIVLGKPNPNVAPGIYQCKDWSAVYRELEKNHALYLHAAT